MVVDISANQIVAMIVTVGDSIFFNAVGKKNFVSSKKLCTFAPAFES